MKLFLPLLLAVCASAIDSAGATIGSPANYNARIQRLLRINALLTRKMAGEDIDEELRIILMQKVPGVNSIFINAVDDNGQIKDALLSLSQSSANSFSTIADKIKRQNERLTALQNSMTANQTSFEEQNEQITTRINTKKESVEALQEKFQTADEDTNIVIQGYARVYDEYSTFSQKLESHIGQHEDIEKRMRALNNPYGDDETLKPTMDKVKEFATEVNQKLQSWLDFAKNNTDRRFDFAHNELFTTNTDPTWMQHIKLVGAEDSSPNPGAPPPKGLVNVLVDGTWGRVCDDEFTSVEASIACRSMGFNVAKKYAAHDSDASWFDIFDTFITDTPMVLDEIDCHGNETYITDCNFDKLNDCGPGESLVLWCT